MKSKTTNSEVITSIQERVVRIHQTTAPDDLAIECEDAAHDGARWSDIWAYAARKWGFVDLDGRIRPGARRYYAAMRRGYRLGRSFWLEHQRSRSR